MDSFECLLAAGRKVEEIEYRESTVLGPPWLLAPLLLKKY